MGETIPNPRRHATGLTTEEISRLSAAGLSTQQMILVAKILDARSAVTRIERIREYDRERKRRKRVGQ